jgi:hypothetical protein
MNYSHILARVLGALVSIFQASTLRDRYYTLEQRHELYQVAIDDIARINTNSLNPNALIANICHNLRNSHE